MGKRATAIALGIAVAAILLVSHGAFFSPGALAQRVNPDTVWRQVYEKVPDLPLENQYTSAETRRPVPDNTLVGRLVRYHIYVKGRPPQFRLDWKITLADYLGLNERLDEMTYPSRSTLRPSPFEGDVAAIQRLTYRQRQALVQGLVDAFAPPRSALPSDRESPTPPAVKPPTPPPSVSPSPKPAAPPVRGPGAADLLK
jgi:hypothetical protein